ncbi:MAG: hypothetical protein HKN09_12370 [Saprospiraceae bacterium]|nr:hypothetical protein [Saprospiraceae bacterium]
MKPIGFYIICFFIYLSFGCGEYERLAIEKDSQRTADSLFRAHKDSLSTIADSLCALNYSDYLQSAIDSVTAVQIEKINNLINK